MIDNDTILKIFEAARPDLEQHWCPHPRAIVDAHWRTTTSRKDCLMNWLNYHTVKGGWGRNKGYGQVITAVYDAFLSATGLREDVYSLGRWNDSHTHAEVMAAVDATIAALKGQTKESVLPDSLRNLVRTVPEKV